MNNFHEKAIYNPENNSTYLRGGSQKHAGSVGNNVIEVNLFDEAHRELVIGELCSSISRGTLTMPPILCDSSEANSMDGDFSGNAVDMVIEPKLGRVPTRAGRAVNHSRLWESLRAQSPTI